MSWRAVRQHRDELRERALTHEQQERRNERWETLVGVALTAAVLAGFGWLVSR